MFLVKLPFWFPFQRLSARRSCWEKSALSRRNWRRSIRISGKTVNSVVSPMRTSFCSSPQKITSVSNSIIYFYYFFGICSNHLSICLFKDHLADLMCKQEHTKVAILLAGICAFVQRPPMPILLAIWSIDCSIFLIEILLEIVSRLKRCISWILIFLEFDSCLCNFFSIKLQLFLSRLEEFVFKF